MPDKKISRRQWLNRSAAASLGLAAGLRMNAASPAEPDGVSVPNGVGSPTTLLFFDDQRLNRLDGVTRHVGRPKRIDELRFQDPKAHVAWGYPSVFFDAASGKWRMTYNSFSAHVALLAESEDGLHWKPRDTTAELTLPDRTLPNQIFPSKGFGELATTYIDDRAAPEERLKALVVYHPRKNHLGSRLLVSGDGLRWKEKEGVEWQTPGADPGSFVFWNDVRKSYTFTSRPDWTDRRIALHETTDWQKFSKMELAIQSDALDSPLTEPYGMPVIPYHGYYVGLLWLFHTSPLVERHSPHKFFDGKVDCQLAYSLNGWHWQRGLRDAFIPNGAPGEPDCGCVYPSSWTFEADGSLRIYASATTEEHGYQGPNSSCIVAYRLRRDGFTFLQAGEQPGFVGTRALYWRGGEVELNARAGAGGSVRVQITDKAGKPLAGFKFADCIPLEGDQTAWTPRWRSGNTLAQQTQGAVRIEAELRSAQLYSMRGDFVAMTGGETYRLLDDKQAPQVRPGF
jgi:hypothetical protein